MALHQWINGMAIAVLLSGCSSHIDKVVPNNQATMKQVYEQKAGNGGEDALRQREADIRARPITSNEDYLTELPPRAVQIKHLFPTLPNPELYMYVKPHVVGASGAAVPAYMTRFTMYERTHYAMPNEVVSKVKHQGVISQNGDKNKTEPATKKSTSVEADSYGN